MSAHAICKRPRGCRVNCESDTTTASPPPPRVILKGSEPEDSVRSGGEAIAIHMAPTAPDALTTGTMSFFPARQPRRRYLLTFMLVLGIVGVIVLVTPICLLCLKVV